MAKKRFKLLSYREAKSVAFYISFILYLIILITGLVCNAKYFDNFTVCFVFCSFPSLIIFYFSYEIFYYDFGVAELRQKEISKKSNSKLQLSLINKLEYHSLTQVFIELNTFYDFFHRTLISSNAPWDLKFYAKLDRNNDILVFIFSNDNKEPIRLRIKDFNLFNKYFVY